MEIPAELQPVVALLPDPVSELRQPLPGPGRPWLVRYGLSAAILRSTDPRRFKGTSYGPDVAHASIEWLHRFLRELAATGFVAPRPVADLRGESIAVSGAVIWELLTFVPGQPMGWTDDEIFEAGRTLARSHQASLATPPRSQRPGSGPLRDSRPALPAARSIQAEVDRGLAATGEPPMVIHGDATQANMVIDDGAYHLVDFALAYQEAALADVGSALWRNARTAPDSLTYDPHRLSHFVRGYASVIPQPRTAGHAIVRFMLARGLQLQHRLERREANDPTILARLLSIHANRDALQEAATRAIAGG